MDYLLSMTEKMTVLYNDTCPICSREVNGYRRMTAGRAEGVVYAGLSEGAYACHGLTEEQAARRFYVVKEGALLSGVPAFAALWQEVPRLRWMSWLVSLWGLRWLAAQIYDRLLAPVLFAMHKRRQRRADTGGATDRIR